MDGFTIKVISAIARILIVISVSTIVIVIGILVLKDVSSADGHNRRCPKCGKRTRRRAKSVGRASPPDSPWVCPRCGNDTDEFGNKP